MRNFSFSHSVFYLFGELSAIFIELKIVICKFCQFGCLKFVVWERVNQYKTYHFDFTNMTLTHPAVGR